ncbi:DUF2510 domain-containing protein [Microbacterium sp. 4R-513]|uniref:DUF2510 domain-containing protein n=1 Tax=Microbacterium sp. 4R-513 TaxID=2567934 RepID=UPI0013E1F133|nr:DUF2510 domain-containing protein [Microbacterium sp. 4R-513]QIG39799.1 DUF2510 domain-containing protein [Microbacterium sp. 4R-513]
MSSTPPGWYDDGHGARRWWDGARWTEQTQTQTPDAVTDAASPVAPAGPDPVHQPEAPAAVYPLAAGGSVYPPAAGDPVFPTEPGGPVYPPEAGGPYGPGPYAESQPAQKRSKLWIVWVVIGVVVLGLVITAIVVIPMLLSSVFAAGGGIKPGNDDEQAAVDAVQLYDDAWSEVDCDKFFAATTESFRAQIGLAECDSFEGEAQGFSESTDEYEIAVTDISRDGGTITVATTETYLSLTDDENQPLATREPAEVHYEYYVVADGDHWAIDDAASD